VVYWLCRVLLTNAYKKPKTSLGSLAN